MRYFTSELWAAINEAEGAKEAAAQWESNRARYLRQLAMVLSRLPLSAASFFFEHSLHDGLLVRLCVGGELDATAQQLRAEQEDCRDPASEDPTTLRVTVATFAREHILYELFYTQVKALDFQS